MNSKPDITKTIGNTPLVFLKSASKETCANIFGKTEFFNPASSVKDRIGLAMIDDGLKTGKIKPSSTIVEPTSGNTGIALAFVCRVKGLKLILTMPETMSLERRALLKHLGATLVLTPGPKGMKGAIEEAKSIVANTPNAFMPDQFSNPANPEIHRQTTAPEIWEDTKGRIDFFVAGVGTGGTITGVSEVLKEKKPSVKSIAVEPLDSPVISGGQPGPHKIQGIGAGFIPANLNVNILDETITVKNEEALQGAKDLAHDEGILCGISSGAAFHAAKLVGSRPENKGKTIVFIICDTGERYLSTDLFKEN
ncbi:MAG: cysteine synthase A [Proteobacteria bacterium]|nr:cysteine synthase A [Pseudomonadota bacterium]MBU1388486.1 cysteine synthase A [Pseudomonadota bacterium]MBU1542690.1 cysteine synthase A [Pseudomonadota bacterium]MBU2430975.1 cysteine synthase A [Pseudomonadota bacterium]MBU2482641.1 cysteine synthase A [Pseudomonadota bacterium]